MQGAEWARLTHPFPPEAFGWYVVELSSDRSQARLAPYLLTSAVAARLDELVGVAGWSFQLAPLGGVALVCNLTVTSVTRAAVAQAPRPEAGVESSAALVEPQVLAEVALSRAVVMFGVPLPGVADGGWVDFDDAANEPLYTPLLVDSAPDGGAARVGAPVSGSAAEGSESLASEVGGYGEDAAATASDLTTPQVAASEPRPDGHLVIDRLLERLKAEGLGKEAARLVVMHHGYGRTPEEGRELYGKLRGLLLEKKVVTS